MARKLELRMALSFRYNYNLNVGAIQLECNLIEGGSFVHLSFVPHYRLTKPNPSSFVTTLDKTTQNQYLKFGKKQFCT